MRRPAPGVPCSVRRFLDTLTNAERAGLFSLALLHALVLTTTVTFFH